MEEFVCKITKKMLNFLVIVVLDIIINYMLVFIKLSIIISIKLVTKELDHLRISFSVKTFDSKERY